MFFDAHKFSFMVYGPREVAFASLWPLHIYNSNNAKDGAIIPLVTSLLMPKDFNMRL